MKWGMHGRLAGQGSKLRAISRHGRLNRPGRIDIMTREPNGELRLGLSVNHGSRSVSVRVS